MPKTKSKPAIDEFPQVFLTLRERLRSFLRYFATPAGSLSGRYTKFHYHGVIFWPDFIVAVQRSTSWYERFYNLKAADERRLQRGVPKTGPAWRAWRLKDLRAEVERFLRPLLIATDTVVGADFVAYAVQQHGVGEDRISDVNPERWAQLNDPKNYTFFRHVAPTETALTRVMVLPPPFVSFKRDQAAIPQEIAALYYVWKLITHRHRDKFDPSTVGVEWSQKGYLFINWNRFLSSEYKPPVNITPHECAQFLRGGHAKGTYRLRLGAFPDPLQHDTLPAQTRAVDVDDFSAGAVSCSLVDPLYLEKREELFQALYHISRARSRVQSRQKTYAKLVDWREERRRNPEAEKERTKLARLHTLLFRPFEHVPHQFASYTLPIWFEASYDETAYAISYNNKLYFAPPELLNKALSDRAPVELAAWFYAMDCLSCVERFTDTGHVGNTLEKSRSSQIVALRDQEYARTATEVIKNFISLDDLTARQMRRVRQKTVERMGTSGSLSYDGGRWYHEMVLSTARTVLTASSVRRRVFALIPDRNNNEPQMTPFYSPQALKQFQNAARGLSVVRTDQALTPPSEPAPYLYAWASFCLQAAQHAELYTIKLPANNGHWSPAEDCTLIRGYCAAPRMAPTQRAELLRNLPRHSWKGVVRRARVLNDLLKEVLTAKRRQRYTVGKMWLPPSLTPAERSWEGLRLALVVGVAHQLRYAGTPLLQTHESINAVMKLPYKQLERIGRLPTTYRSDQFERLAR